MIQAAVNHISGIEYFVRLALRAKKPGSSSAEKASLHIARCVLKNVGSLDDQAIDGLVDFLRAAKGAPTSARALIG